MHIYSRLLPLTLRDHFVFGPFRPAPIPAQRYGLRLLRRPEEAGLGAVGAEGTPFPLPEDHALPQDDCAHGGHGKPSINARRERGNGR